MHSVRCEQSWRQQQHAGAYHASAACIVSGVSTHGSSGSGMHAAASWTAGPPHSSNYSNTVTAVRSAAPENH